MLGGAKEGKKNHLDTAVGGFNPSEKYYSQIGSNWIISLGSGENNSKSPPSHLLAKLPRFIIPINGAPQKWRRSRVNSLAAVQPRGETRQKLGHLDGHGGWYWDDASEVVLLREKWWWWHQVVKVKEDRHLNSITASPNRGFILLWRCCPPASRGKACPVFRDGFLSTSPVMPAKDAHRNGDHSLVNGVRRLPMGIPKYWLWLYITWVQFTAYLNIERDFQLFQTTCTYRNMHTYTHAQTCWYTLT